MPKDQTFVLDEKCDASLTGTLWVVLCPWVKNCAPRTPMCPSDDDDDESPSIDTRQRDGFDLRVLRNQPACACHCEPEESDKPGGEDASVNASVNETDGGSTLPVPRGAAAGQGTGLQLRRAQQPMLRRALRRQMRVCLRGLL